MKKKKIIPLLLVCGLFSAVGCNGNSDRPTESGFPSTDEHQTGGDNENTEGKKDYSVDEFYDYFMSLGNGNFSVDYSADNVNTYTDTYTENYIFYGYADMGYALIDSYGEKAPAEKISYGLYYQESTNSYDISTPQYYYGINSYASLSTSMNDFDYFSYFKTYPDIYSFEKSGIQKEDDLFYVTSYYAEEAVCQTLHVPSYFYYGYVTRLIFQFNKEGNLEVTVQGNVDQIRYATIIKGTFYKVGTSEDLFIEDHFKDGFALPKEKADSKTSDVLLSNTLSMKGDIHNHNPNADKVDSVLGEVESIYTPDIIYQNVKKADGSDIIYVNRFEENGKTYDRYLNAQNRVEKELSDEKITDTKTVKDVLDPDALRKISDNTYRYYGTNLSEVIDALFGRENSYQLFGYISGLTFEAKDGVIDTAHLYYGYYFYPGDNGYVDVALKLEKKTEAPELKGIQNADNSDAKVGLSYFDGSHSYQITVLSERNSSLYTTNPSDYTKVTYDKDKKVTWVQVYENSKAIKEYGYLDGKDGLVTFEKITDDDGNTVYRRTAKDDTTKDAFRNKALVNIDSNTLLFSSTYNDQTTYTFQGRVQGFGQIGFIDSGEEESKNVIWGSCNLVFTGSGEDTKLKTLTYTSQKKGGASNKLQLTFSFDLDIALTNDFSTIEAYKETSTWEEEDATFAQKLKDVFSDEAVNIPYVFDNDLHGNFKFKYKGNNITVYSRVEGKDDYLNRYKDALLAKGFTLKSENTYVKGAVQAKLGTTMKEGITFSEVAA